MDVVISNGSEQDLTMSYDEKREGNFQRTKMKFLHFIGAHELHSPDMWRAALTEMIGTAFLMFILFSSIIASLNSKVADPSLLVLLSIFFVAFVFLLAIAPLTGGHMNPTFSFIAALKGVVTISRATIYILGQIIGAIMGFLLIKSVMSPELVEKHLLAGCSIDVGKTSGINPGTAFIFEFVSTFVVLLLGVTVAFDKKKSK
ncbi:Major intrinsic protein [Quillaja saponaria]|uniref:Major intrinsic protein n=1 Tax=Quillaja saponaria TaxID=32244 RepID=A0AAD7M048_QUISA|nr:Major intrinsic protein [Quillaja saponaria]